jgi:hypothetical protein
VDVVKTPADIWVEVCAKAAHDHQARLDFFAAVALLGFMSGGEFLTIPGGGSDEKPGQRAAAWAYQYAEAMEAERAKRGRT